MAQAGTRFRYSLLLREIDGLRAEPGVTAIALLLIQLDGLEEINLKYGYVAGDKLLDECSLRLGDVGRDQDRLFELSGTCFALLVRNPLHAGHAVLAAEKVLRLVGEPIQLGSGRARVRARVGISLLPECASGGEELVRQGEIAVAEARCRDESYVVFSIASAATANIGAPAWFDVEEGLQQGEFTLCYQPQIDLANGRLLGAEALVRWQHPRHGLLSPARFMGAIETGQSVRALLWFVLNAALRQSQEWRAVHPDFAIAVNMSPGNLADPDLVDLVDEVLRIWSFPPQQLRLEITETALMRDFGSAVDRLHELRELGCRLSIDDFGTGYSSLSYLKNLPVDELKIDKSFIAPIAGYEVDRRIVEAIVSLGHAVSLQVVAEGIEEESVRRSLAAMKCDIGQGYLFSPPLMSAEFHAGWILAESRMPVTPAALSGTP